MTNTPRSWVSRLAPYKCADDRRAVFELAITIIPFVSLWVAMWALLKVNILLALLLAIPIAGLMVRLFIIQHDCGHGSMFTSRKVNDWVGRTLGVVTLAPYEYWRRFHAAHHASSGNLDRRGMGDIDTLTVDEYLARSKWERLKYKLYRHPLVMFGLGPTYLFIFRHRLPIGAMKQGRKPWISTQVTNIGIVLFSAVVMYFAGWSSFLLIQIPAVVLGASIGVWMFYVQHQFDPTHWARATEWKHDYAALHGSSYYVLPKPFMWITGNIGIHHVHHLSSRIPFYKLPQVINDHPQLKKIGRITLWQSLKCVRLTLWDESSRRLVSFRDVKRMDAAAAAS